MTGASEDVRGPRVGYERLYAIIPLDYMLFAA